MKSVAVTTPKAVVGSKLLTTNESLFDDDSDDEEDIFAKKAAAAAAKAKAMMNGTPLPEEASASPAVQSPAAGLFRAPSSMTSSVPLTLHPDWRLVSEP